MVLHCEPMKRFGIVVHKLREIKSSFELVTEENEVSRGTMSIMKTKFFDVKSWGHPTFFGHQYETPPAPEDELSNPDPAPSHYNQE